MLIVKGTMKRFIFVGAGMFLLVTRTFGLPNLTPTTPTGWSAPLVASVGQDVTSEDTLYTNYTYYYSWAVTNNGDQSATAFIVRILLADSIIKFYNIPSLNAGSTMQITYLQHKISVPGIYTMKLVVDPLNTVTESNEGDNEYSHDFYWVPDEIPDIDVTPDSLCYIYHIPDSKYTTCSWVPGEVVVDIDVPVFNIEEISEGIHRINIDGFEHLKEPGKPALPF